MVLNVVTHKDLVSPIGWLPETTAEGSIETSGTLRHLGPTVRFASTHSRSKILSPAAGQQDLRQTKYPGAKIGSTSIVYKVIDTQFIRYCTDREEGVGTVANSISMAAQIDELGTTKYWLAEFCRPGFFLLSSGRDLEIIGMATLTHKFTLPFPTTWTSKPTLASDPGPSIKPTWLFSDGGDNPVTWDGDDLDCESIRIMWDRIPLVRPSAGGTSVQVNKCTGRRIRFRMLIGNDATARLLVGDYKDGSVKDMQWTLYDGADHSIITLNDCILDPIPEEYLTAEEDPEVSLSLSGEARYNSISRSYTLSSSLSISA